MRRRSKRPVCFFGQVLFLSRAAEPPPETLGSNQGAVEGTLPSRLASALFRVQPLLESLGVRRVSCCCWEVWRCHGRGGRAEPCLVSHNALKPPLVFCRFLWSQLTHWVKKLKKIKIPTQGEELCRWLCRLLRNLPSCRGAATQRKDNHEGSKRSGAVGMHDTPSVRRSTAALGQALSRHLMGGRHG